MMLECRHFKYSLYYLMKLLPISFQQRLEILFPGLIVVGTIAAAAGFLSSHYNAPVMLFALLIGISFNFLSSDERCAPGIEFSSKKILRLWHYLAFASPSIRS